MKKKTEKNRLLLNKKSVVRLEREAIKALNGGGGRWLTIGSAVWSAGCRCTTGCTGGAICNWTETQCSGGGII
jgi:hypothetical protein